MHLFLKVNFFHLWIYTLVRKALFFEDFYGDCLHHIMSCRQLFHFLIYCSFFFFFSSSFLLFNTNNSSSYEDRRPGRTGLRFLFFFFKFLVAPSTATAGTLSKLSLQNNKSLNKKVFRSRNCYAVCMKSEHC